MSSDAENPENGAENTGELITAEPLRRAIGDRYLTYALSTIMHRALPDARDGLKPVHRRILYAMRRLNLAPTGKFLKSAKISGDTMGDFHPHGDGAIYDAMARLAQDFVIRYPLVQGQGNFGNIDGDGPAASRYTEARLTKFAEALLDGLDEDAVDFQENYDGRLEEPSVLPSAFPNLLANGASGIAVGMATNIPPHNIDELVGACLHLIDAPNARDDTLLQHVKGPDFPTGGIIVEPPESVANAYKTGRGSFRLRARWEVEDLPRGMWQIVVTEIPYQVQKSKLIEKLAELIQTKKVPILADVRDESAEDIRLILEPKSKAVDPAVMMETLFRLSDLETRFSLNMNCLIDGRTPKVCSLKEVLRAFLDHRRAVLVRRATHRLDKIDRRLEVLEGYIVAFLNLDRVIQIIREEDEPKAVIMDEFNLTDVQAEAILNMRLRALRKLEEMALRKERDDLMIERADLQDLLEREDLQWSKIGEQLREVRKEFGKSAPNGSRKSELSEAPEVEDVPVEAMIEREPITVVCSEMGWIRAMKGHIDLSQELKYKDGDGPRFVFHAETTDRLLLLGENGRFYTIGAAHLPGGRGMGEPVRLMVDLPNEAGMVALFIHVPDRKRLLASSAGDGFIVSENEVLAQTRNGKQVLNVRAPSVAKVCRPVDGNYVAVVGENRKVLAFPIEELPEMARGKGVRLQKYKDGGLSDARSFDLEKGLDWKDPAGRTRVETDLDRHLGKRAGAGAMAPRGFPRDNKFTD
ncbi:MAG: DNA topoisomerase IV subunit A [Pseudomonadota bacterium]